jgi:hypothetical protein
MERMKLTDWAAEIERQSETKRDFFIPDTRSLEIVAPDHNGEVGIAIEARDGVGTHDVFRANIVADRQVADKVGIPVKYWDRMKEDSPELLVTNANHWLHNQPGKQLVRTMDGRARAYLSDRYAAIDHWDIASTVLPVLGEFQVDVKETEITERRMYLKCVFPKVQGEVKVGDTVQAGLVISNSEVGMGRFLVQQFLFRLVCLNGMVGKSLVGKVHLGGSLAGDSMDVREVFTDETKAVSDEALMRQVQDVVRHSLNGEWFNKSLDDLRLAAGVVITKDTPIQKVVERIGKEFRMSRGEGDSVLRNLIEGGDLTAWGMANAITATARDTDDYDRVIELERIGNRLIERPNLVAAA